MATFVVFLSFQSRKNVTLKSSENGRRVLPSAKLELETRDGNE